MVHHIDVEFVWPYHTFNLLIPQQVIIVLEFGGQFWSNKNDEDGPPKFTGPLIKVVWFLDKGDKSSTYAMDENDEPKTDQGKKKNKAENWIK